MVSVNQAVDARASTENAGGLPFFFTAAAPIYPGNTDTTSATDCTPATLHATQVGTFFVLGGGVGGLPGSTMADPYDVFFVLWHFRIDHEGAFDTTGPARDTPTYPQTIVGSTNPTSRRRTVRPR